MQEPFVDVILETTGRRGRLVREYTLLFDPPSLRQQRAAPAPRRSRRRRAIRRTRRSRPRRRRVGARTARPHAPAAAAAPRASPRSADTAQPPRASGAARATAEQVTVQSGDTLARSPQRTSRAERVARPDAGGAVPRQPERLHRRQHEPPEGRRRADGAVRRAGRRWCRPARPRRRSSAQSADFGAYRQRLAERRCPRPGATPPTARPPARSQAPVDDKKPAAATPDKLTLSQGRACKAHGRRGQDRQASARAQDAATRVAELNKNIGDLKKLGSATAPATAPARSAAKPARPCRQRPPARPSRTAPRMRRAGSGAGRSRGPPHPPPQLRSRTGRLPPVAPPPPSRIGAASPVRLPAPRAAASRDRRRVARGAAASAAAPPPAPAGRRRPRGRARCLRLRPSQPDRRLLENPLVPAPSAVLLALLAGFGFYRGRSAQEATAARPRSSKAACSPIRSSAPAAASASTPAMRGGARRR